MAESLYKRDREIEKLKQMQKGLQERREELVGELRREHPQIATDISKNVDDEKFQAAVTVLLEYLNSMKLSEENNGQLIDHAIGKIQAHIK